MTELRYEHQRSHTHRRSRAGFTLLELMVAMTAGALVISSTYMITRSTTKYFREQQRISQTQGSLRNAMEKLRRDIARAGFCATPNSAFAGYTPPQVMGLPGPFTAISMINANFPQVMAPVQTIDGIPLASDTLQLIGNYTTSNDYSARSDISGATQVVLDATKTNFIRDFQAGPPYATIASAGNPFQTAFLPGRMVGVESQGFRYFSAITAAAPATATVSVATTIPVAEKVAPVSVMRYSLVANPFGLAPVAPGADANNVLMRQEVDAPGSAVAVGGTVGHVIAENVIHFNVDYIVNNAVRGATPVLAPATGGAAQGALAHTVFSAIVTLGVRTPMIDPAFNWITQAPGAELTSYGYNPVMRGAHRVRIARAEIFLPNVAYRWTQ